MKEYREAHHLTQEQMAELIGVSRITICRIEAGSESTKLRTAQEIVEKCSVSMQDAMEMLNFKIYKVEDDAV